MKKTWYGAAAVALLSVTLASPALGQLNPFAPTDAMDTLNSAPTGGGGFDAIGRAESAVASANAPADPFGAPSADPFGNPAGAGGDPFGAPAANPFGASEGGGADPFGAPTPGGDPFGAPNPFGAPGAAPGGFIQAAVAQATLSAWGGERLICHRTGQVLQDAREINILASMVGSYYDDGKQGNDAVAGDNIYTNIIISREHLSPEAHLIKTRLVQTLQYASELTPKNFNLVRVATTEPLSDLPKEVDLERERDKALGDWAQRFLSEYRKVPDQMDGEFYPTYMPPPPQAPNIPLPSNFSPNIDPAAAEAAQAGLQPGAAPAGDDFGADPGVTGEPVGNASSRYF
jgi:hypothetical protein